MASLRSFPCAISLASVDITSTGGTQLGGNVYTTGSQTYNSAVTLTAGSNLGNTVDGSLIWFKGAVDSEAAENNNLNIQYEGSVRFDGQVGKNQKLGVLSRWNPPCPP